MSGVSCSGPAQTPESSMSVQYAIPETKVNVKPWNHNILPKKRGFFEAGFSLPPEPCI